jgi:hypothetical protein
LFPSGLDTDACLGYSISGATESKVLDAQAGTEKVGPGGHYPQEKHMVRHVPGELWMPSFLTRQHHDGEAELTSE